MRRNISQSSSLIAITRLWILGPVFLLSIISCAILPANDEQNTHGVSGSLGLAVSPNYYCGLYCVYASAKRLGVNVDFNDLLQPKYLTGSPGSTVSDLRSALEDLGLKCDVVSNLSVESLTRFTEPVILHTRAGATQKQFSHWMVYAGFEPEVGHKLYDPPFENGALSAVELQALWGGTALIVYKADDQRMVQRWLQASVPSSKMILFIAFVFLCLVCITQYLRVSPKIGMVVAVLLTCGVSQFSSESFARNWSLVGRQSYYPTNAVKRASLTELEKFRDVILVDARTEQQHAIARVSNSSSLPLGSGYLRMKQFVSRNDGQQPIVVYCESKECAWAELVAKELISLGRENVYVMDEGFRGWRRENLNE